ncbi:MAG: hypothetical protein EA347_09045 [Thioalkalivibrio sp.]|nr:MAG: hypothetical protein EA347_09045 [Thioalkalivibrio sp.]
MSTSPELLLEKLKALPPQRLSEVEDFVDFLRSRDERATAAASRRLGEAMARLDAMNLPPLTADEVQAEIEAVRTERRSARGADRR